jgi:hypothetical protein
MDSFTTWMLRGLSAKQNKSRLLLISNLIDWPPIRQILDEMYDNKSYGGNSAAAQRFDGLRKEIPPVILGAAPLTMMGMILLWGVDESSSLIYLLML